MTKFTLESYLNKLDNVETLSLLKRIKNKTNCLFNEISNLVPIENSENTLTKMHYLWLENEDLITSYLNNPSSNKIFQKNIKKLIKIPWLIKDSINEDDICKFYMLIYKTMMRLVFEDFLEKNSREVIYVGLLDYVYLISIVNLKIVLVYEKTLEDFDELILSLNLNVYQKETYSNQKYIDTRIDVGEFSKSKELINYNLVDLRNLYLDKYYYPVKEDVIKFLNSYQTIFQIILPLFDDNDEQFLNFRKGIKISLYLNYEKYFNHIFKLLSEYFIKKTISIYIPFEFIQDNYYFWYLTVRTYFNEVVKIGPILNLLDDIYDIEKLDLIECCLINFNHFVEDYNNYNNREYNVKGDLEDGFRNVRAVFNEKMVESTIYMLKQDNYQVLDKLLTMGYRSFKFSTSNYISVNKSLNSFAERRGLYNEKNKK